MRTGIIKKNRKIRGVSYFSEVNNELLMWAHYSSCYKSFCLKFWTNIKYEIIVFYLRYDVLNINMQLIFL